MMADRLCRLAAWSKGDLLMEISNDNITYIAGLGRGEELILVRHGSQELYAARTSCQLQPGADTSQLEEELDMLEVCAAAGSEEANDSEGGCASDDEQQRPQRNPCSPFTIAPLGLYISIDTSAQIRTLHFLLEYALHGDVHKLVQTRQTQMHQWLDRPAPQPIPASTSKADRSSSILLFSESEMRFVAACLLLGVACMHGCGIAHRDLRPANLLLDSKGYLRVGHFERAAWVDANGEVGGVVTPEEAFCAPEARTCCQSNYNAAVSAAAREGGFSAPSSPFAAAASSTLTHGSAADDAASMTEYDGKAADLWSVGACLHYIFTGSTPQHFDHSSGVGACLRGPVRQLIKALMHVRPDKRISAQAALQHVWFDGYDMVRLRSKTLCCPLRLPRPECPCEECVIARAQEDALIRHTRQQAAPWSPAALPASSSREPDPLSSFANYPSSSLTRQPHHERKSTARRASIGSAAYSRLNYSRSSNGAVSYARSGAASHHYQHDYDRSSASAVGGRAHARSMSHDGRVFRHCHSQASSVAYMAASADVRCLLSTAADSSQHSNAGPPPVWDARDTASVLNAEEVADESGEVVAESAQVAEGRLDDASGEMDLALGTSAQRPLPALPALPTDDIDQTTSAPTPTLASPNMPASTTTHSPADMLNPPAGAAPASQYSPHRGVLSPSMQEALQALSVSGARSLPSSTGLLASLPYRSSSPAAASPRRLHNCRPMGQPVSVSQGGWPSGSLGSSTCTRAGYCSHSGAHTSSDGISHARSMQDGASSMCSTDGLLGPFSEGYGGMLLARQAHSSGHYQRYGSHNSAGSHGHAQRGSHGSSSNSRNATGCNGTHGLAGWLGGRPSQGCTHAPVLYECEEEGEDVQVHVCCFGRFAWGCR